MKIRDRVKELRRVRASDLRPHPLNWRTHPDEQRSALRACLDQIGFAGVILAVDRGDELLICDGHLRAEEGGDAEIPVVVLDLSDDEVSKLLATYDPLTAMAETNTAKLEDLLREIDTGSEALQQMLSGLAEDAGIIPADDEPTELKQIDVKPPPKMSWVLLGIPTVRFGEIAADVERLATLATVCETTVNDG